MWSPLLGHESMEHSLRVWKGNVVDEDVGQMDTLVAMQLNSEPRQLPLLKFF